MVFWHFPAEDGASLALVLAPNQRRMTGQFVVAIYAGIKCVTALELDSHDIALRVVMRTLSLLIDADTVHNHLTCDYAVFFSAYPAY